MSQDGQGLSPVTVSSAQRIVDTELLQEEEGPVSTEPPSSFTTSTSANYSRYCASHSHMCQENFLHILAHGNGRVTQAVNTPGLPFSSNSVSVPPLPAL